MTGWAHLTSFVQNDGQTRELLVSAISARLFVKQQHSALGNDPLLHAPYPAFDRLAARSTLSSILPNLEPTLVPIQGIYTLDAEEAWDAAIVLFCV